MDATDDFYAQVLGFTCVAENQITVEEGGHLRQVEFDIGDVETVGPQAGHVVSGFFRTAAVQHCNLEPKAALASWSPDGRLSLITNTQVPFHARKVLHQALGVQIQPKLPPRQVHSHSIVVKPWGHNADLTCRVI